MNGYGYGSYSFPSYNFGMSQYNSFPGWGGYNNIAFQAQPWTTGYPSQSSSASYAQASTGEAQSSNLSILTSPDTSSTKSKASVMVDLDEGIIRTSADKKVSFVETTPEKAEEFKKKCKKDERIRGAIAIGLGVIAAGLAVWLGPKGAAKLAAKVKPAVAEWILPFADSRLCCGINGSLVGLIPGAFYACSNSGKKALAKEYFPEAYAK